MTGARFDDLKRAILAYGEAAFQNLLRARALADAIVAAYPDYIGAAPENVAAVPPFGPFDPRQSYGEAAFSFHERPVIVLEPVRFGLSLIVGNAEDSGALWLRTSISAEVAGDHFDVFVAERPIIRTPLEFEGQIDPILEAVHQEFLATFELEVQEFNDARFGAGIGFLPG